MKQIDSESKAFSKACKTFEKFSKCFANIFSPVTEQIVFITGEEPHWLKT